MCYNISICTACNKEKFFLIKASLKVCICVVEINVRVVINVNNKRKAYRMVKSAYKFIILTVGRYLPCKKMFNTVIKVKY